MKRITLEFKSKHTEEYILNKCLDCVSEEDIERTGCIGTSESNPTPDRYRDVSISFDIEDEEHFRSQLNKIKISDDLMHFHVEYGVPEFNVDNFAHIEKHLKTMFE